MNLQNATKLNCAPNNAGMPELIHKGGLCDYKFRSHVFNESGRKEETVVY